MNYLFKNPHNGHMDTYHPFIINIVLSQEKANEFMLLVRGDIAYRIGAGLKSLIEGALSEGYEAEIYKCKCCLQEVNQVERDNPYFRDFEIIEGISGSY